METARIVLGRSHVELRLDARLREFDFGAWDGLTWDQIVQRWPDNAAVTLADAANYHPDQGESFLDVERRVASFLNDLERESFGRVLVATHAGVLHAALRAIDSRLPQEQRGVRRQFSPGSITRVAVEGERARLVSVNDVGHFDSAG